MTLHVAEQQLAMAWLGIAIQVLTLLAMWAIALWQERHQAVASIAARDTEPPTCLPIENPGQRSSAPWATEAAARRLEARALHLEAQALRLEAGAMRLEALGRG